MDASHIDRCVQVQLGTNALVLFFCPTICFLWKQQTLTWVYFSFQTQKRIERDDRDSEVKLSRRRRLQETAALAGGIISQKSSQ